MFGWTFGGAGAGPQPQLSKGQKKRQKQKAKEAATSATPSGATKSKSEDVKVITALDLLPLAKDLFYCNYTLRFRPATPQPRW